MTPRDAILIVKVKVLQCWTTFLAACFKLEICYWCLPVCFFGNSVCLLVFSCFILWRATNTESRHWEGSQRRDAMWRILHNALSSRVNVATQAYLFASRSWRGVSSNRVWIREWEQSSSCGSCGWVASIAISVIDILGKLTEELHSSLTRSVSLAHALALCNWELKLLSARHVALCDSFQL